MAAAWSGHKSMPIQEQGSAAALLTTVKELTAELHPHQPAHLTVNLDSRLDKHLGLDSLARVELLARIEKLFGIALPERAFTDAETPRDLLRAVLSASGAKATRPTVPISKPPLGETEGTPQTAQTLVDILDWHVTVHGDRPHVQLYNNEGTGELISYAQLRDGASAVAAGLQHRGLQPGDAVAIMLPTGTDYFFSFYGILLAGGIPVPIYPPVRLSQLEDHLRRHQGILNNCVATMLVTTPEAKPVARLLKSQLEKLHSIVTVDELAATGGTLAGPALGPGDIALLQYTSGSTGKPKGVVLTHAALIANIRVTTESVQADASDVFVSWLPLYHDMGLIGAWLGSLYCGVLLVVMSPLAFLARPERWLQAIHRHGGTLSAAPNFGYELAVRRIENESLQGLDLKSWRLAFNGAEPVSPATLQHFSERFAPYGFRPEAMMPVYGLAESSVGLAFPPLGRGPLIDRIERETLMRDSRAQPAVENEHNILQVMSCGHPLPGHEIRIIDSSKRELPERHQGQLQFRGPSSCSGYFRNPEETQRLFAGEWLNSGDMAYIAHGEVYITSRSKDVIIHGGRNIYPQELEEVIGEITGIRKGCVAVIGSPDPKTRTERLVVLAETRETDSQVLEQLQTQINTAATDIVGIPPDDVALIPPHTLLKTSSGKLRHAASRDLYERGRLDSSQRAVWWQVIRISLSALMPELRRLRRKVVTGLYAAYAWFVFGLLSLGIWLSVALLPRLHWRWAAMSQGVRWMARLSGTHLSVQGLAQLPPANQPCVLVANHMSYLDGYVLVAALRRPFSFVAKTEFQQKFITRLFLSRIGASFVERFDMQKGVADARNLVGAVRGGRALIFFPEGTFTRMPGLLAFHMGAFVAAGEAGVPVVPVTIRGSRSILRANSWFPRHGAITLTIGEPINPQALRAETNGDPWKTALALRNRARDTILRHCGEPDLAREKLPL